MVASRCHSGAAATVLSSRANAVPYRRVRRNSASGPVTTTSRPASVFRISYISRSRLTAETSAFGSADRTRTSVASNSAVCASERLYCSIRPSGSHRGSNPVSTSLTSRSAYSAASTASGSTPSRSAARPTAVSRSDSATTPTASAASNATRRARSGGTGARVSKAASRSASDASPRTSLKSSASASSASRRSSSSARVSPTASENVPSTRAASGRASRPTNSGRYLPPDRETRRRSFRSIVRRSRPSDKRRRDAGRSPGRTLPWPRVPGGDRTTPSRPAGQRLWSRTETMKACDVGMR